MSGGRLIHSLARSVFRDLVPFYFFVRLISSVDWSDEDLSILRCLHMLQSSLRYAGAVWSVGSFGLCSGS